LDEHARTRLESDSRVGGVEGREDVIYLIIFFIAWYFFTKKIQKVLDQRDREGKPGPFNGGYRW
jgi:hypothetical protein